MAEAFRESNPAVQFAIQFSGTGGGFKKFCAGQLDIADASRPIKSDESEQCEAQHVEYIEVPVAFWCPARPAISRQYQTFRLVYFGGTYMDQEYPA